MRNFGKNLRQRIRGLSGRSRAIGMFFATSVAARGVGIACQLVQVPIAMKALGAEAFGLWMTLTGIGAVIAFADFGVGQGAQNKLAEAFAAGQRERARELWDSTLVFFGAVGLALATVFVILVPSTDFSQLFGLREAAVQQEAGAAVAVMLGVFCLNFPFGLAQRLAYSRQKGWMHNVALAAGSVGGLLGTIVAIQLRWSLPFVILAAQVPVLIGNSALMFRQLVELGWTDVFRARARWATMRELAALGACFGVQQMQLTLFVALPQVIISTHLGAAAVTPYNLVQRLFNLFAVVQNAFMLPLWPAYSEAKAKGDFDWVRRTLRVSIGATVACTLVPMALGALFAHPIISAWVGTDAVLPSMVLVWLMFAWNALVFIGQPFGYMLAGLSEVRRLTQYAVVSSVLSTVLMVVLVSRYGAEGVVAGMTLGFLPFLLRGNIAEALLVLRRIPGTQTNSEILNPTPAVETRGWR
jgi:O-antigen/teichoic acid export membrane protein